MTNKERRDWERVSALQTPQEARALARLFPSLGAYVARLDIERLTGVAIEYGRDGHCLLDGSPSAIARAESGTRQHIMDIE